MQTCAKCVTTAHVIANEGLDFKWILTVYLKIQESMSL